MLSNLHTALAAWIFWGILCSIIIHINIFLVYLFMQNSSSAIPTSLRFFYLWWSRTGPAASVNLSMHTSSQQGRETYAKNVCKERVEERGILCFRMCSKSHQLNQTLKFLTLHHLLFSVDFRVYPTEIVYTEVTTSKAMYILQMLQKVWNI